MYNKVSTNLNFVEREKATEQFWKDNGIFEKSIKILTHSTMVLQLQMVSHISVTF